jgi:glycosyltransferase involved in cell wall biosynthesis
VADFRDLWSRNHNYPYGFIRRLLDERLETRTMAACAGFSSVSLDLCRILCNVYPQRPVALIRNGFDPESAPAAPPPTGLPLRMLYSGNIYVGRQDPLPVLDALAHLIGSGRITRDDVRLDFRGPNHEWLHLAIARRGLEGVVTQREKLPWREALAAQRNAQMFLLLDWEAPRDVGVIPLKSFEYLAAGRPILATGGPAVEDEVDRVLLDTRAGSRCRTVAEIEAALEKAVRALRATGEVPYGGIRERIEAFAYPNMAGRFAALLDEVTGGA